jgi:arylsulfatase A-like enzyme
VIPADTKIEPWPEKVLKPWDQLSADEKKLFIKQVEIFAAYEAYNDYEIGRVIQSIEDMGKLDNTLVIYINGDNGTSAEGGATRNAQRSRVLQRRERDPRGRAVEMV